MRPILLDTGFLVASLDRKEDRHEECAEILSSLDRQLISCESVIAEANYLLRHTSNGTKYLFENIEKGTIAIPWMIQGNATRLQNLFTKYSPARMDLADACLILMAEDFEIPDILTLDSDFLHYRWAGKKAFKVLPQQKALKT
jgi:uncharacterized protein